MKTKLTAKTPWIAALLLLASGASLASSVGPLTTFTAGTTAVAAEVNGNFSAVRTAVNDNHARIGTLEGVNAAGRLTTLEGVNAAGRLSTLEGVGAGPRLSTLETTVTGGNVVLAPSTTATGNILKGANRFLHNFGTNNTFLGMNAGNFTMTGGQNTAIGYQAFQNNTTGTDNTAIGYQALQNNTTGSFNTANGRNALFNNTTGESNTAIGPAVLFTNTSGVSNTAIGGSALSSNTIGVSNTAIGLNALTANTTGNDNIAIGIGAGQSLTTGNNNIAIGHPGVAAEAATIRIGTAGTHLNAFVAGISGATSVAGVGVFVNTAGQLGTLTSSQRVKDHIADMGEASNTLMKLRPVTFHYKSDQNPKGRSLQYGLVAEEVEKVAPGLVARSANGEIETVFYQHLTPMLLNEVQKQQRLIEAQTALLAKQTARVAELEQERRMQTARIETLEKQTAHMTVVLGQLERVGMLTTAGR